MKLFHDIMLEIPCGRLGLVVSSNPCTGAIIAVARGERLGPLRRCSLADKMSTTLEIDYLPHSSTRDLAYSRHRHHSPETHHEHLWKGKLRHRSNSLTPR